MYYNPPVPVRTAQNSLGTAGFVLGWVGLGFAVFIPFMGILAWVVCAVGIPLAGVGMRRIGHGAADNRGITIAGLILNVVALAACGVDWLAYATIPAVNHY